MQLKSSATFPMTAQADKINNSQPAPPARSPTSPIAITTDTHSTNGLTNNLTSPISPTSPTSPSAPPPKPSRAPITASKLGAKVTSTLPTKAPAPIPQEPLIPPKNAFIDFQPPQQHIILEFPNTDAATTFHAEIKASIVKPMHPTWAYIPLPHGLRRVRRTDRGDMAFEFDSRKLAEEWVRSTGNIGRLGVAEHRLEKAEKTEEGNEKEEDGQHPHKMGFRERAMSFTHHERERRARTVYLGYLLVKDG
jgi:hypothetical protein